MYFCPGRNDKLKEGIGESCIRFNIDETGSVTFPNSSKTRLKDKIGLFIHRQNNFDKVARGSLGANSTT